MHLLKLFVVLCSVTQLSYLKNLKVVVAKSFMHNHQSNVNLIVTIPNVQNDSNSRERIDHQNVCVDNAYVVEDNCERIAAENVGTNNKTNSDLANTTKIDLLAPNGTFYSINNDFFSGQICIIHRDGYYDDYNFSYPEVLWEIQVSNFLRTRTMLPLSHPKTFNQGPR